jgi:hypothetical protein
MKWKCENEIPPKEVSSAIKMWVEYFQTALFEGITENRVAQLMTPVARDHAWIYHGGTGMRSRLYMIDDYVQARFDFDYQDVLVSYAIYARQEGWLKGPRSVLLHGFEASDVELLFP